MATQKRRHISVTDELWTKVETRAAEMSAMLGERVSASAVVRIAIRELLAPKEGN